MGQHWLPAWRETFDEIFPRQGDPAGLRRMEVTTGDGNLTVFEPPDWTGNYVALIDRRSALQPAAGRVVLALDELALVAPYC